MNRITRVISAVTATLFLFSFTEVAKGLDVSETIFLERYTIMNDGTVTLDQGNLLRSGQFKVLSTDIDTPLFGVSLSDLEPISGRPIMLAQYFDGLKAAGAIPKWVRSRYQFDIGIFAYVIVSVSGRGDPNPIPVILQQPQSQRIIVGNSAWLSVDARPHDYISYQWKFRGKALPNYRYFLLIIPDIAKTNGGVYTVTMNAGGKSVVSRRALLTVVLPVSVKAQPISRSIKNEKNAVFRVAVQGTGPFTYQWFHNDVPIPLATKSFYTIVRANETNEGSYKVGIDNGLSYAVSDSATLIVNP